MSTRFDYERAVRASDLPPLARLVALILATHTSRGGLEITEQFTPSLSELAIETGASEATVKRMLIVLDSGGWLVRHKPTVAAARTLKARTRYTLTIPAGLTQSPATPELGSHRAQPGVTQSPALGSRSTPAGLTLSHRSKGSEVPKTPQGVTSVAQLASEVGATEREIELLLHNISTTRPDIRSPLAYLRKCHQQGDLDAQLAAVRQADQAAVIAAELAQARTGTDCIHGNPGGQHRRTDTGRLLCPMCQRNHERSTA
ncbi:hypothetical protein [Actinosynnema sp. NPDC023587]|uniref:hypothetical protein n=1 Tax=Actinosynnema sp. NPDC023587 TaxID=3154695 RepID=UPI0034107A14